MIPKTLEGAREKAEATALMAIAHISGDNQLLDRFLAETGATSDDFASELSNRPFLLAVLEFVLRDEGVLLVFCEHNQFAPDWPAKAVQFLRAEEFQ